MNIILFDDSRREYLLPLTYTRPVADLRIGILRIIEKWKLISQSECSFLTSDYLQEKFPLCKTPENILIAGSIIPDENFFAAISSLEKGEALLQGDEILAAYDASGELNLNPAYYLRKDYKASILRIRNLWDIFRLNGIALQMDFINLTKGRKTGMPDKTNQVIGNKIFIEEGAKISCSIINTDEGPVYIGKNAEIWEGSMIRGPFALCEGSSVKMGAKIYGPTTVGPYSRVGGEISNTILQGYSNKGHDGFLGNAVLGEWCNIGADSNNSNLKNNYDTVKIWSYPDKAKIDSGLQFCGLFMGDHSKCGINTMFNTGTVAGVFSNIFGAGFPPGFIPSFSWGGYADSPVYELEKAIKTAEKVFARRDKVFDDSEKKIIRKVFELSRKE